MPGAARASPGRSSRSGGRRGGESSSRGGLRARADDPERARADLVSEGRPDHRDFAVGRDADLARGRLDGELRRPEGLETWSALQPPEERAEGEREEIEIGRASC